MTFFMISSKKIVLVGHFGVGKTSIIRRFVSDVFSNDYKVTIGVHIFKKEILTAKIIPVKTASPCVIFFV